MNFVLDNSVVMRWLFNDGVTQERQYAEDILNLILTMMVTSDEYGDALNFGLKARVGVIKNWQKKS